MPFANEHAARLLSPDTANIRIRRTRGSGEGRVQGKQVPVTISVVWFVVSRGGEEVPVAQSLRFPIANWTESEARAWLRDNEINVQLFEAASGSESSAHTDIFVLGLKSHDGYMPEVTNEDGVLTIKGHRIFKANTPMKHEVIYTPEELAGAVKGPTHYDIDHNYLAFGEDDFLERAYMDDAGEWLLGDSQFTTPTIVGLIESGALDGLSVVTEWQDIEVVEGQRFAKGVNIPNISLTNMPYCGDGGVVEGCGITHSHITEGSSIIGWCESSKDNRIAKKTGGEKLTDETIEELQVKVSELTKDTERLNGELKTLKEVGIDLNHPTVEAHVKSEVSKAIEGLDVVSKLTEAIEKIQSGEHSGDLEPIKEMLDKLKTDSVTEHTTAENKKAVDARKEELNEQFKDCEHSLAVIKDLDTIESLDAFVESRKTGHRLGVEGDAKAAELAQLDADFRKAQGKPIKKVEV